MECIKCNTKNSLKECSQNLGQCKRCNHQFVFNPVEMEFSSGITDALFEELIAEISDDGTVYFTPIQLYYLLEKRLRSNLNGDNPIVGCLCYGGLLLVASIWIVVWLELDLKLVVPILVIAYIVFTIVIVTQAATSPQVNQQSRQDNVRFLKILSVIVPVFGIPLGIIFQTLIGIIGSISLGLIAAWLSYECKRQQSKIFDNFLVDRRDFQIWLNRWISINDFPEKILASPNISTAQATCNPRVIAYKFDRVVVCDSPKIAQLLLKNNFHFANNCAVLSIDRYPHRDFVTIKAMLDLTPNLQVFALHDCSPQGLKMIRHLRTEKIWFPDLAIPIISVGILPRQIRDNTEMIVPQSAKSAKASQQLAADLRNTLDPTELTWLDAGYYLELESLPPQELVQILQRAINHSHQLAEIEDGDPIVMNSPGFYTVESLG